jgi:hypothetical protein
LITAPPAFRWGLAAEQEHLDDGAGGECLYDCAARRLEFRSRLAHFHPGDPVDLVDLLPQRVGGPVRRCSKAMAAWAICCAMVDLILSMPCLLGGWSGVIE